MGVRIGVAVPVIFVEEVGLLFIFPVFLLKGVDFLIRVVDISFSLAVFDWDFIIAFSLSLHEIVEGLSFCVIA